MDKENTEQETQIPDMSEFDFDDAVTVLLGGNLKVEEPLEEEGED